MEPITQLGDSWDISSDQVSAIEKYVCRIYNSRKSSVNEARFELFMKKYVCQ